MALLAELDFKDIEIEGVQDISKEYLGGYYVVSINEQADPFAIVEKISKHNTM